MIEQIFDRIVFQQSSYSAKSNQTEMSESLSILIVENHKEDARVVLNELRAAGFDFSARTVESESEFLAALLPAPDLILTNYRLSQFNALHVLELLRERALDIPVIVVAANISEELAVEAIKQGAADFLNRDRLMRLGIAIHRALAEKKQREAKHQAEAQLRHASLHDPLTGLYNRVYFDEELARLERGGISPASVIVADVDGLKAVNDQQGHAAGDELLINAALLLGSLLRRNDVLARIGGDEFCVLLPGVDEAAAISAVKRIRRALKVYNRNRETQSLSLSIGIATGDCIAISKTLQRADANMYAEKRARQTRAKLRRSETT